nr:hypothetical protein Iba_chr04bCG6950 [Ipomoea batatas]
MASVSLVSTSAISPGLLSNSPLNCLRALLWTSCSSFFSFMRAAFAGREKWIVQKVFWLVIPPNCHLIYTVPLIFSTSSIISLKSKPVQSFCVLKSRSSISHWT